MQNSLQVLVSQHVSLQNQFKHAEQCFNQYLQMALYSNLDVSEPIIPNTNLKDSSKNPVILFLDNASSDGQIFQKLYFALIRKLNDIGEKGRFTIVVIDRKGNLESFINLLNILRMIPMRFIAKMRIVVVSERLINREELKQHPFENYISSITVTINNIPKLKEIGLESVIAALKTQGIIDLTYKKRNSAANFRGNYVDRSKRGSLNIDQILETRRHPTLASYQLENGVPKVLIELIQNLKSKLDTAGIFRISPSIQQQQPELLSLDQQNIQHLSKITNPHIVCSLIKKIFSRLEPPLFSYELYEFITMEDFQNESGLYLILSMVNKLPEANHQSLKYLAKFIHDDLLKYSESNKMKSSTLAVIFAPVFLRSFNPSHDDLKHMSKMILIVKRIIDSSDFLFQELKPEEVIVQKKGEGIQKKQTLPNSQKQKQVYSEQKKIQQSVKIQQPVKIQEKQKQEIKQEQKQKQVQEQKQFENQKQDYKQVQKQVSKQVQRQIQVSDRNSVSSEPSSNRNPIKLQKTVEIAISMSSYDNVESSPCKSQVSDLFQNQDNNSNLLFVAGKKSSVPGEAQKVHSSKISTQESSNNKFIIHSCQILQQKDEKQLKQQKEENEQKDQKDQEAENIKEDDENSDFQKLQENEEI